MVKAGMGGGEGKHRAGKRKRPAGSHGSRPPAWGGSLAWKDVTPADSLSVLVGSGEGGFLSLEEIDGDVFVGTSQDVGSGGNLLGALPGVSEEPAKSASKRKKRNGKKPFRAKANGVDTPVEVDLSLSSDVQRGGPAETSIEEVLPQSDPSPGITAKPPKRKKAKKKKLKVGDNLIEAASSNAELSQIGKTAPRVDHTKPFVLGPVVGVTEGTQESTLKDVEEEVPKAGTSKAVTKDGIQKKVKLGSKARKLAKMLKGQAGATKGKQSKEKFAKEGELSEEDLSKREDMEMERLENEGQATPIEDVDIQAIDMSAWTRLRLHPLLEKALSVLGFSEPTPIQKACIPAAAFQGKDVIGAAETGSGKTLAFGLPILQRLLDEQEKSQKTDEVLEEVTGKVVRGPLRALIITPTRELALQVCDHLRAVATYTSIKVVPIVGGMAPQKQQRLLKYQPQIVVGTPGRLWELMSVGETHLLDLSSLSFFILDEADRMVERGHFKELQTIIDMLPKTMHHLPLEPEKHFKARKKKERREDESIEVYPDSDDDDEPPSNSEEEEDEEEEEGVSGEDGNEQSGVDDFDMDDTFPSVGKVEAHKKRQTLVFSATLALPAGFKKQLKKGYLGDKGGSKKNEYSVASLSERAGMRHNAAIIDLTSNSILAKKLEESVIECRDEEKDAYLYYILKVHGCGRTLVFCTSIAALRRVSAILCLLQVPVWSLHAQMQQKQRLKAMDRFKTNEDCVMVATDVAARGLDVTGIRTVIHYQLPHSAEMYVHRSGRTARADTDGCSIALISPSDRAKYTTLCRALNKENGLPAFPIDVAYVPATLKRVSLAIQVDKVLRKHQQSKAKQSWVKRNAEALEIDLQNSDNDDEGVNATSLEKKEVLKVESLQQELQELLKQPLEPKAFSRRYITGSGVTPLLAKQLKEYTTRNPSKRRPKAPAVQSNSVPVRGKLVVIGQEANEPLDALRRFAALSKVEPKSKSKRQRR